jgi:hypothetical protein
VGGNRLGPLAGAFERPSSRRFARVKGLRICTHAIVMHFVMHECDNFGFRFNLFENENRRAGLPLRQGAFD